MEIQFLNARQGDAIWIRWGDGHQMLIDMGTAGTGRALAERIRALPEAERAFELLVVTHVDTDHIGGVLTCLVDPTEPIPGLSFADVWFNGWEHLHGRVPEDERSPLEPMGGVQGEKLTAWLRDHAWNEKFGRAAVVRGDVDLPRLEFPGDLSITVVAPVQDRLTDLIESWREDVEHALETDADLEVSPGLESMGPSTPPILESEVDLELLTDENSPKDPSKANAASISLIVEADGRRILLTGDAIASELISGLALVDGDGRVPFDLVKLPHHGSRQNISRKLIETIDCPLWVFSSDGTTFRHPDAVAIGRVLRHAGRRPRLAFNVPSTFNKWWENPEWIELFGYDVTYGDAHEGLVISLDPPR